jgi:cell division protein ZapA (FtsZ GTPase activity inhibitor)
MTTKRSVAVRIAGHEYRIRSEADEEWLQKVANYVDHGMEQIRERTGTVDTLDVAILTALNLARENLDLRAKFEEDRGAAAGVAASRIDALIDLVESAMGEGGSHDAVS